MILDKLVLLIAIEGVEFRAGLKVALVTVRIDADEQGRGALVVVIPEAGADLQDDAGGRDEFVQRDDGDDDSDREDGQPDDGPADEARAEVGHGGGACARRAQDMVWQASLAAAGRGGASDPGAHGRARRGGLGGWLR